MQLISRNAPVSAGWCCAFFPDYTNTPRGSHNCWNAIHPLKCGAGLSIANARPKDYPTVARGNPLLSHPTISSALTCCCSPSVACPSASLCKPRMDGWTDGANIARVCFPVECVIPSGLDDLNNPHDARVHTISIWRCPKSHRLPRTEGRKI